ncbi:hypothetical protein BBJ28_00003879 [Nothophytophthora sp. Chile5]|nr:hypothetical protein BBJ28_00003879 [Nothophytophthora sp. Chile5]
MSAMNLSREQQNDLLFVGFNQDSGACGHALRPRLLADVLTFSMHVLLDFSSGGIGIVEMLFRCNILAIVGGGRNPRYPPNKVRSCASNRFCEMQTNSPLVCISVVVVLQNKIYVYNFSDLKLVDHVETIANPKGLCALCPNPSNTVLACPGVTRGTVRIELYDLRKTTLITAHEAELSQVWRLHRTDKGTVHVFSLTAEGSGGNFVSDPTVMGHTAAQGLPPSNYSAGSGPRSGEEDGTENSKSRYPRKSRIPCFSFMRGLLPKYFSSEWSFAQFRVPETRTICAFGTEKNTIVVVGADGSFYKAVFDANGECQNTSYSKFIQSDEDE